jgi:S-ribosylhomocysteine lyase
VIKLTADHLTTFDLRITRPNFEEVLSTGAIHAIEHLGATFVRNHVDWQDKIIYFGPMGCRTGFYLIVRGLYGAVEIAEVLKEMMEYIIDYQGEIPGATPMECGNYKDIDLNGAKEVAERYLKVLKNLDDENTKYRLN